MGEVSGWEGEEPLLQAVMSDDPGMLQRVVERVGKPSLVKRLSAIPSRDNGFLDRGAAGCSGGWTLMHVAAGMGKTRVMRWMLHLRICLAHLLQRDCIHHGENVSVVEEDDSFVAVGSQELLQSSVSPTQKRWSALHWAAHGGHIGMLCLLLEHCYSPATQFMQHSPPKGAPHVSDQDWVDLLQLIGLQFGALVQLKGERARKRREDQKAGQAVHTSLLSWGSGASYALGNGTAKDRVKPGRVHVVANANVVAFSAGRGHSLCTTSALSATADQEAIKSPAWAWGEGAGGKLGMADCCPQPLPRRLPGSSFGNRRVTLVAAGGDHSAIVTADGSLFTFGSSTHGQLGLGSDESFTSPRLVKFFRQKELKITAIACGDSHTVALTHEGRAFAWGCGTGGATGLSVEDDIPYPSSVPALADERVAMIAAGENHSVFVTSEMDVYQAGHGQEVPFRLRFPQGRLSEVRRKLREKHVQSLEADLNLPTIVSVAAGKFQTLITTGDNVPLFFRAGRVMLSKDLAVMTSVLRAGGLGAIACGGERSMIALPNLGEVWEWPSSDTLAQAPSVRHSVRNVVSLSMSENHTLAKTLTRLRTSNISPGGAHLSDDLWRRREVDGQVTFVAPDESVSFVHLSVFESVALPGKCGTTPTGCIRHSLSPAIIDTVVLMMYGRPVEADLFSLNELDGAAASLGLSPTSKWQELGERLLGLINSRSCDVSLVFDEGAIRCHRSILAARSPFFDCLLSNKFSRSEAGELMCENVSLETGTHLTCFIYGGAAELKLSTDRLLELYSTAHYLLLKRLVLACESELCRQLSMDGLLQILNLSEVFASSTLRQELLSFCLEHMQEVVGKGLLAALPENFLQELQQLVNRRLAGRKYERLLRRELLIMGRELIVEEEAVHAVIRGADSSSRLKQQKETKALRKKLLHIFKLLRRRENGEVLNEDQEMKLLHRPGLLSRLSLVTGTSVEELASQLRADAAFVSAVASPSRNSTVAQVSSPPLAPSADDQPKLDQFPSDRLSASVEQLELATKKARKKKQTKFVPLSQLTEPRSDPLPVPVPVSPIRSPPPPSLRDIIQEESKGQPRNKGKRSSPSGKFDKRSATTVLAFGSRSGPRGKKQKPTTPPSANSGWSSVQSGAAGVSLLDIQQEEVVARRSRKQNGGKQRLYKSESQAQSGRGKLPAVKKSKPSLRDILAEEEARAEVRRKRVKPNLRSIIAEEEASVQSDADAMEERMLALALEASLVEQ